MKRNLICNNSTVGYGGGIEVETVFDGAQLHDVVLINNTITKNKAKNGGGIAMFTMGSNAAYIEGNNNIVYGNTANSNSEWFKDSKAKLDLTYTCCSQSLSGAGNITGDPQFVDAASGDFHLKTGSPCIDKGDPASDKDPDNTQADMGALFYSQGTGVDKKEVVETNGFIVNVNGCNSSIVVRYKLGRALDVEVEIVNVAGKKVFTLINSRMAAGNHRITWGGRNGAGHNVSPGIYLCRFSAGNNVNIVKVLLAR